MVKSQPFTKFEKVTSYYPHALAIDDFDLEIRQALNDTNNEYARIELVFLQEKGSAHKIDVVAAVRMQSFQLRELRDAITNKLKEFDED